MFESAFVQERVYNVEERLSLEEEMIKYSSMSLRLSNIYER